MAKVYNGAVVKSLGVLLRRGRLRACPTGNCSSASCSRIRKWQSWLSWQSSIATDRWSARSVARCWAIATNRKTYFRPLS